MQRRQLLLVSLLAIVLPAFAGAQSVEPDNFSDGQDISTATPGVTLSAPGNGSNVAIFAVADGFAASTGTNVFGYFDAVSMSLDTRWHQQAFSFQADFSTLVMSVSLDFIMQFPFGGLTGRLVAFDAANNQIAMAATPVDQNGVTTLTVSSPVANISRIQAFYDGPGDADAGGLDNLVVVVPEPGTISLLMMALVGGAAFCRRRRRS